MNFYTVPTHNSDIFVGPKNVTILGNVNIWVIVTIEVIEGFRIEGIESSFTNRLLDLDFLLKIFEKSFSDLKKVIVFNQTQSNYCSDFLDFTSTLNYIIQSAFI